MKRRTRPEHRVILCSDGVHEHLTPSDFAVRGGAGDPQAASEALVALALARGTTANASAVVLWYRPGDGGPGQATAPAGATPDE